MQRIPPQAVKRQVYRRLKTFGCKGLDSHTVASRIEFLLSKNGDFWTITYLKAASEKLKQLLGASPLEQPKNSWVRLKGGFPEIFYPVLRDVDIDSVEGRTLLIRLTSVPKAIKPSIVNRDGIKSLSVAIQSAPKEYDKAAVSRVVARGVQTMLPFSKASFSPPRSKSIVELGYLRNYDLRGKKFFEQFYLFSETKFPHLRGLIEEPFHPFEEPDQFYERVCHPVSTRPAYAGEVHCSPEPGGKTRLFASPDLWVRALTLPLLSMSRSVLEKIPEDCTSDQRKFKTFLLRCFDQGQQVWSIDQSQATDRWPLELQILTAKLLGLPSGAVDEFGVISRLPYRVPKDLQKPLGLSTATLKWRVGQPLGVYPSFNMYALSHHAVVRGLFALRGKPPCYMILGDDIAIADDEVASDYIEFLKRIGCVVNLSKSYVSSSYAEGAGFRVSAEVAVLPGRFQTIDQFNFKSFLKDGEVREGLLNIIPDESDNPFVETKKGLRLKRSTVLRLLKRAMEDESFKEKLKFFSISSSIPDYRSQSGQYLDLFNDFQCRSDSRYRFDLVEGLSWALKEAPSFLKPSIQHLITAAYAFGRMVTCISGDRLYNTIFELVQSCPVTVVEDYQKSLRHLFGDLELDSIGDYERLKERISLGPSSILIRMHGLGLIAAPPRIDPGSIHLLDGLFVGESPFYWLNGFKLDDRFGRAKRVEQAHSRQFVTRQIANLLVRFLTLREVIPNHSDSIASYSSFHRQFNNCLKLVGFRRLVSQL